MTQDVLPDIGIIEIAEIDHLSTRYARGGATKGIPIVLTAPWPESIYSFHRILPRLVDHPLIAVDLPGFGLSQSRADVMAPQAMGEFLARLLNYFRLERVHAVTPDVGTLAALFAAAKDPHLFESLALGGAPPRVELAAGALKDLIHTPPGALANIDGVDAIKDYLDDAGRLTPAPIIEDFEAANRGRRLEDATQYVRSYKTDLPKLEPLLAHVRTPVLVIAGSSDSLVPPECAHLMADALPNSRLTLLDAGHRVWEEAAEAYGNALTAWFAGGYHLAKRL